MANYFDKESTITAWGRYPSSRYYPYEGSQLREFGEAYPDKIIDGRIITESSEDKERKDLYPDYAQNYSRREYQPIMCWCGETKLNVKWRLFREWMLSGRTGSCYRIRCKKMEGEYENQNCG